MQRNKFEMQAHDIQYRKRDKQQATFSGGYHNDKPLYWTMLIFIGVFCIIALALYLNK